MCYFSTEHKQLPSPIIKKSLSKTKNKQTKCQTWKISCTCKGPLRAVCILCHTNFEFSLRTPPPQCLYTFIFQCTKLYPLAQNLKQSDFHRLLFPVLQKLLCFLGLCLSKLIGILHCHIVIFYVLPPLPL